MVTPFPLSPSSPFPSPTKFLRSFSSITVTKASPLQFLHCKRLLSVSVTSSFQNPDSDSPPLPPKVQTFWQWLRDEGVVSSKTPARPAVVLEGLGLVAQRDLSRNEVVLEVPKRLWINPDAVAASEIGTVCSELKPWVSVALFLIREKLKNDSPWRYYLDILPEYTNSTIYWSEEELAELQVMNQINHSPSITTEDHAWEIKGAASLFSWDSLFSLRTPVSVKAGEQVMIQYDINKSNADLALDYGFIEPKDDRNGYTLTLEISESDPFFGDKLDIAEANGLGETAYFDFVFDRPLPPSMLQYLRLVALGGTDSFLLESIFRNSIWGHLDLPVSHANEELICRVVRDACKSALSGYHTTIEEDEKLKGANLDPRLEIAVGIREGEKKVLLQIDEIFKGRESELDELEYYQERRLKDLGLCGEQGEIIFWEPSK
ncbi:hypothetical protein F2P56_030010 [Juglans regia]|uniref:SET domain-containing protein n=2 Tax=Juglans regia TaxID=51240 RepID=A0A833U3L1_JUGRE|nr:ribulose-1,5 bisphosphate carboxylase/oxygenase large subunit N-methyltransferase, chloroplastic-like isoform X2 [Juglans regia]KAF5449578.1 hypothetical protein F2P56_030010 [Juglans regia]